MDADAGFCRLPHWPAMRRRPAPTPARGAARPIRGRGRAGRRQRLGRLGARLVELVRLAGLTARGGCSAARWRSAPATAWPGARWRAAWLLHWRLEADGRRVAVWQVLAPTEWNASARHAGAGGGALLDTGPRSEAARPFALAFDPCVDVEVICDA